MVDSMALCPPFSHGAWLKKRDRVARRKAKTGGKQDPRADLLATYLGLVVWHQESHGVFGEQEAETWLNALITEGVQPEPLRKAYSRAKHQRFAIGWLDVDLQTRALGIYSRVERSLQEFSKGSEAVAPRAA